ncbi:MAG: cobalamin-dependent protein [Candidatus Methanomethylicaceae archaeon]
MDLINDFESSIINLEIEKAIDICKKIISLKEVSMDEIFKTISKALDIVGKKYENNEYFLSELIMAGEIVKEILKIIEPFYKKDEEKAIATVVLATVKGDLHDIGKNIVAMLLNSSNFKVIDLGVDVSSKDIVKAVKDNNANILGLSALLTTTIPEFKNVIQELKKERIRDKVKVIIGGAAVNDKVAKDSEVDAWARNAIDGLRICKQWVGGS